MREEDRPEFSKQTQETVSQMRTAFDAMDRFLNELMIKKQQRVEYEEAEELCCCVSEMFASMADELQVVMYVTQTYGNMLVETANKILQHKDDKKTAEVKQQIEAVLAAAFDLRPTKKEDVH